MQHKPNNNKLICYWKYTPWGLICICELNHKIVWLHKSAPDHASYQLTGLIAQVIRQLAKTHLLSEFISPDDDPMSQLIIDTIKRIPYGQTSNLESLVDQLGISCVQTWIEQSRLWLIIPLHRINHPNIQLPYSAYLLHQLRVAENISSVMPQITLTTPIAAHLSRDQQLGRYLWPMVGIFQPLYRAHNLFWAVIITIVGQQINKTLANKILGQLEQILLKWNGDLRHVPLNQVASLSLIKQQWIQAFIAHYLQLHGRFAEDQATLTAQLLKIKGIGQWSVDMILMFYYQADNIISPLDLGIRKGWEIVYQQPFNLGLFQKSQAQYHPYKSAASIVLWVIYHNKKSS